MTDSLTGIQREEEVARVILENEPGLAEEPPSEAGDPPCPRCGSTDASDASEATEPIPLPQGGGLPNSWRHECRACGYSWLD